LGKKRAGTWKCFFLSIALMIIISLVKCAALRQMEVERKAQEYLIRARELFDQGDFAGSLKENQKVLSCCDNTTHGDEALFNAGLIYAHYGYTKRDYKESLEFFKRLVKVFPQSPLAGQAKMWIRMLQENEKLNKKIGELDRIVRESKEENEGLNRKIEDLNRKIEELNRTIKNSKQIDIEIDEKKKKLSR
jgi:tetratricopeptide (TPR) repeat protein